MAAEVSVVKPEQRGQLDTMPTPGMKQEQAYFGDGAWVGVVHTAAGPFLGCHNARPLQPLPPRRPRSSSGTVRCRNGRGTGKLVVQSRLAKR